MTKSEEIYASEDLELLVCIKRNQEGYLEIYSHQEDLSVVVTLYEIDDLIAVLQKAKAMLTGNESE